MRRLLLSAALLTAPCLLQAIHAADEEIDIGLTGDQYKAWVVVGGLSNPSGVTFSPDGRLTVCDSANGRVVIVKDGVATDYITEFSTEYWKVDATTGAKRFRLGPLSSVWLNDTTLAVTNAGVPDGQETVLFFDGPGKASDGAATNMVGPTTDDAMDKGEGNFTGLSLSADGSTIYVASHGNDKKTWIASLDVRTKKLTPTLSADDNGIDTNSPTATMPGFRDGTLMALYSGAGGKDDGLIVIWDTKTGKPVRRITLPGLTDPMGFARIPNGGLVVVDNNWSLTEVKPGRLARVMIPREGDEARVSVIADNLRGPVSCTFGPDGDLYIAQLGTEFDSDKGQVIRVSGIKSPPRNRQQAPQQQQQN